MQGEKNLVWIDLEMSGLALDTDVILEIATIITDGQLNLIAQGPSLVVHQPDEILNTMNKWCKDMHGKSGLTKAVQESSVTLKEAEEQTLNFIKQYCKLKTGLLSGNSIWQDRMFLNKYMPGIIEYLHYKMIDVTSIAEMIGHWYPNDPNREFKKKDEHRALPDIIESIEELRHLKKYFFSDTRDGR